MQGKQAFGISTGLLYSALIVFSAALDTFVMLTYQPLAAVGNMAAGHQLFRTDVQGNQLLSRKPFAVMGVTCIIN